MGMSVSGGPAAAVRVAEGVVAASSSLSEINVTPFVDVMLVLSDHLHGRRAAA
jgi:hypothetical protein